MKNIGSFLVLVFIILSSSLLLLDAENRQYLDQHTAVLGILVSQRTSTARNEYWLIFLEEIRHQYNTHVVFCVRREPTIFHHPKLLSIIKSVDGKIDFQPSFNNDEICGSKMLYMSSSRPLFLFLDATSPVATPQLLFRQVTDIDRAGTFKIDQSFTIISSNVSKSLRTIGCGINGITWQSMVDYFNFRIVSECSTPFSSVPRKLSENPFERHNSSAYIDHSFHQSGPCQLWWPLNHTELFVHSYIHQELSPLRMKQKIILACHNGEESHFEKYSIILRDIWSSIHCIDCESVRSIELPAYDVPQIFQSSIELHHGHVQPIHKRLILKVHRSDTQQMISEFNIWLNIKYGQQHWHSIHNVVVNACPIHPMASQLESRDDLGFALNALLPNATTFVEVGVQHGNFAQLILNTWKSLTTYIAIDSWTAWPSNIYYDIANNVQSIHDNIYLQFLLDIEKYGEKVSVIKMDSLAAAELFTNESVDMVYLDAMHHYFAVKRDIETWWPKIRPGGCLSGHDYVLDVFHSTIFSVKPAVDEFARSQGLLVLSTQDENIPAYPSWFLFKPCHYES